MEETIFEFQVRAERSIRQRLIREEFRGAGASKAAYVAILAVHRAKRALGYTPEERFSVPIGASMDERMGNHG